jgi:hypothetical protein
MQNIYTGTPVIWPVITRFYFGPMLATYPNECVLHGNCLVMLFILGNTVGLQCLLSVACAFSSFL